ncbi:phenazine biosynthesis-like domain-containing protein 1 [Quercus suber]|uniref:Phenazine biosynthesis-like domain-containing protein 1 n=1 Tax=Quercus suber TaxID=58331 RepID=A0AAW0M301_QUESU
MLQAVAAEFNIFETCYLTRLTRSDSLDSSSPRFRLRCFTPIAKVELYGHATLAAAHALFPSGLVNSNFIELVKLPTTRQTSLSYLKDKTALEIVTQKLKEPMKKEPVTPSPITTSTNKDP